LDEEAEGRNGRNSGYYHPNERKQNGGILRRRRRPCQHHLFLITAVAFGGFVAHLRSPLWLEHEVPSQVTMAAETTPKYQGGFFSGGGVSIPRFGGAFFFFGVGKNRSI